MLDTNEAVVDASREWSAVIRLTASCRSGRLSLLSSSLTLALACGGAAGGPRATDAGDPFHGGDGTNPASCSAAATYVYVIDTDGQLRRFDPHSLTFETIGALGCVGALFINSMAVDRNATAWVSDLEGHLFEVSTADASCKSTSFSSSFHINGMGFASDSAGGSMETLYVADGKSLATLDLTTMGVTPVGAFDGVLAGASGELTGTGDGRLYGFFTTTPARVAEIDTSTAHILSVVPQPGIGTLTDWAFSFWGGDFYLYTARQPATSDVTRYRPSDGSTTRVLSQIGFQIVGAGVSTCAPTEPPN